MNAELLQRELSNDEIKEALKIAEIIKSADWSRSILQTIQKRLLVNDSELKLKIKEDRYLEIFYDDYLFWIELYYYTDNLCLWIADKSNNKEINPIIDKLGFKEDVIQKGFHYFKNENIFKYVYPSVDNFDKLIFDILQILKDSKKNSSL